MVRLPMIFAVLLFAVLPFAATSAVAGDTYVPDSNPLTGTCNGVPFNPTFNAYRYQVVFNVNAMGGKPITITSFSLSPCENLTFTANKLEIRMANFTGTPTSTFDNNLGASPTVVRTARAFSWQMKKDQWTPIRLDRPHVYDGTSSLVIEIRYHGGKLAPQQTLTNGRVKRAVAGNRFYSLGPGSYNATTALYSDMAAFKICITGASLTPSSAQVGVGNTVTLALDSSSDAGNGYFVASAFSIAATPVPGGQTLYIAQDALFGVTLNNQLPTIFRNYQGTLDAQGKATASIAVPGASALIGLNIHSVFGAMNGSNLSVLSSRGSFVIVQ